jgi:hypothetical protein
LGDEINQSAYFCFAYQRHSYAFAAEIISMFKQLLNPHSIKSGIKVLAVVIVLLVIVSIVS